jgi:hypothetical protein
MVLFSSLTNRKGSSISSHALGDFQGLTRLDEIEDPATFVSSDWHSAAAITFILRPSSGLSRGVLTSSLFTMFSSAHERILI